VGGAGPFAVTLAKGAAVRGSGGPERLADSHIKEACRRRPRSSPSWSTSPTSRASPTRKSLTSWARRWAP